MYYFAYASNLNQKQMRERCPDSKPVFTATLPHYKLVFLGWSREWHGATASIRLRPVYRRILRTGSRPNRFMRGRPGGAPASADVPSAPSVAPVPAVCTFSDSILRINACLTFTSEGGRSASCKSTAQFGEKHARPASIVVRPKPDITARYGMSRQPAGRMGAGGRPPVRWWLVRRELPATSPNPQGTSRARCSSAGG